MIRSLFSCLWPGAAALALLWLALRQLEAGAGITTLLAWPLWPLCLVLALLAARFHRSRLIFGIVVLALSDQAVHLFVTSSTSAPLEELLARLLTLLPFLAGLALLAASLLPERGLLTLKGGLQLTLFLLPAALIAWVVRRTAAADGQIEDALASPLVRWLVGDAGGWIDQHLGLPEAGVPWPHLAFFGLLACVQLGRYLPTRDPVPRAFAWVSLAVPLLVWPPHHSLETLALQPRAHLLLGLGTLLLGLTTLEVSYALAYRDELTGLPGRRALQDRLRQLSGRYSLAMVDIDHFKKLNDRHGHDVGDQVLRMVAAQLHTVGGGGHAYRYGGEEFTIVFPGRNLVEAGEHLEALRQRIADTAFMVRRAPRPARKTPKANDRKNRGQAPARRQNQLRVTVSIGAAQRGPAQRKAPDVLELADTSLYRAKRGGRNRVHLAAVGR